MKRLLALLLSASMAAPASAAKPIRATRVATSAPAPIATLAPALALPPVSAAALRAPASLSFETLTAAEGSLARLEAFHETFSGSAFSGQEAAALAAIYERAKPGRNVSTVDEPIAAADFRPIDALKARLKKRLRAFFAQVEAARSGRFGLDIGITPPDKDGQMDAHFFYTLDGRRLYEGDLSRHLAAGTVSQKAFIRAQAALKDPAKNLAARWAILLEENRRDVRSARDEVRKLRRRLVKSELAVGKDLQNWGIPNVVALNKEYGLKYVRVYRLGGQPTELGLALHGVLAPLIKKDPDALKRISAQAFDTAVLELARSLRYRLDPDSAEGKRLRRKGELVGEGYDYPQWHQAHIERARKALAEPSQPKLAKVRFSRLDTTATLKKLFDQTRRRLSDLIDAGASPRKIKPVHDLFEALHAAMALPMGSLGYAAVKHRQLLPLIAALRKQKAGAPVIAAVLRSYPLGESLWRLGIDKLWARGITGKGIRVALIDNGVSFAHPDLAGLPRTDVNLTRDKGDHRLGEHGTAMAGIIRAIAPEARIDSYQVLSSAELPGVALSLEEIDAALMKALDMAAASGARIISMSLGGEYGLANDRVAKKIERLRRAGITVVVAAGNEGEDLPPGFQVTSPGSAPAAITVGAVDYHGVRAPFSSKGQVYDPAKPLKLRDKPDVYAFGVNTKSAMALPKDLYGDEPLPYDYISGTSPATPHVSAVVALMLQAAQAAGLPLTGRFVELIKSTLIDTATRIAARRDLPPLPVLLDAEKAVDTFLERLERRAKRRR